VRVPLPRNRLVALTLAGAVLTALVAAGLAFPVPGVTQAADSDSGPTDATPESGSQAAAPAPTPNADFTPAVQSGYEDDEHEADEEFEERDDEAHEEHEEYEEREEGE